MIGLRAFLAVVSGLMVFTTTANAETLEELKRELAAKKAHISKLERRIRELERHRTLPNPLVPESTRVTTPVAAERPVSIASPPPDDEGMDRALERTLVREGGLVLSAGTYELSPQLSYAHWDKVQDPDIRNSYAAAMSFRVGLPWQTQLSFSLPYVHNEGRDASSGLGDAGFLVSKEVIRESDWVPNLVGSVGWTSPTSHGNTFGPIPYVSGFQAGLTASKKLDPLVVFMSASYFSSLSHEVAGTKVNPSDVVAFRMGSSLAISPATALTAGMTFNYLIDPHAADFVVPNSDRLLTTVDVGLSTIIWKRTLLNITTQFGVTGHVPDFRLMTSIPIRF
jgi:hypothetical protein